MERLYTGPQDADIVEHVKACNPRGPLLIHIAKLYPKQDCSTFDAFGRVFSGTVKPGDRVTLHSFALLALLGICAQHDWLQEAVAWGGFLMLVFMSCATKHCLPCKRPDASVPESQTSSAHENHVSHSLRKAFHTDNRVCAQCNENMLSMCEAESRNDISSESLTQ